MDFLNNILKIQNIQILEKIANDNFSTEIDKKLFIEKYNKINYQLFNIVKDDIYLNYVNRINKFNK